MIAQFIYCSSHCITPEIHGFVPHLPFPQTLWRFSHFMVMERSVSEPWTRTFRTSSAYALSIILTLLSWGECGHFSGNSVCHYKLTLALIRVRHQVIMHARSLESKKCKSCSKCSTIVSEQALQSRMEQRESRKKENRKERRSNARTSTSLQSLHSDQPFPSCTFQPQSDTFT